MRRHRDFPSCPRRMVMKRPPVTTRKRVPRPAFSFAASPPSTSTTSQLLAPPIIAQQRGCVVQVDDEDIDISIVVVIGEGSSPTHLLYGHARSGGGALFGEMRLRHGGNQSAGRHQQLSGCVQPE